MASIIKHHDQWRAHLCVNGRRESQIFPTRGSARFWAMRRENELKLQLPDDWAPPRVDVLSLEQLRKLPKVDAASCFSGVYFLWSGIRLAYIGQSKDVGKRVATHRAKPPTDFFAATFLRVPHPWQLSMEQIYIDAYLPSWKSALQECSAGVVIPADEE